MITFKELKEAGFKEVELHSQITKEGYYFRIIPEDLTDYVIFRFARGRVYKSNTRRLVKEGYTLDQWMARVQQDAERPLDAPIPRQDKQEENNNNDEKYFNRNG